MDSFPLESILKIVSVVVHRNGIENEAEIFKKNDF